MGFVDKIKEKIIQIKEKINAKKQPVNDFDMDRPHKGLSRSRRILISIFCVLVVAGIVAGTTRTVVVNNEVEKYRKTVADAREEDFSPKAVDNLSDAAVNKLVKEAVDWGFVSKADSRKLTDKEKRNVAKAYSSTLPRGTGNYSLNDLRRLGYGAIKEAHDPQSKIKQPVEKTESVLVSFKDYDDSLLAIRTYKKGDKVSIPTIPKRKGNKFYEYKFKEWTPAVQATAKEDATYMAVYVEIELETGEEKVLEPTPIPDPDDAIEPGIEETKAGEDTEKDPTLPDKPGDLVDGLTDKLGDLIGSENEKIMPTEDIINAGNTTKKDSLPETAIQVKDIVLKNDLTERIDDVEKKVHDSKANIRMEPDPTNNKKYYIVDDDKNKKLATLKFLDQPSTILMSNGVSGIIGEDIPSDAVDQFVNKYTKKGEDTAPYALYTTTPAFGSEEVYYPGGETATFHDVDGGFTLDGVTNYIGDQVDSVVNDIAVYVKGLVAAIILAVLALLYGALYVIVGIVSVIGFIIALPFIFAMLGSSR